MSRRLGKLDWIKHGLVTLARDGPNALRVEAMAKKLRVSRGSFYWHFRDIKDFRSQLLRSWEDRSTDQVIQDLDMSRGSARSSRIPYATSLWWAPQFGRRSKVVGCRRQNRSKSSCRNRLEKNCPHRKVACRGWCRTKSCTPPSNISLLGVCWAFACARRRVCLPLISCDK